MWDHGTCGGDSDGGEAELGEGGRTKNTMNKRYLSCITAINAVALQTDDTEEWVVDAIVNVQQDKQQDT